MRFVMIQMKDRY